MVSLHKARRCRLLLRARSEPSTRSTPEIFKPSPLRARHHWMVPAPSQTRRAGRKAQGRVGPTPATQTSVAMNTNHPCPPVRRRQSQRKGKP